MGGKARNQKRRHVSQWRDSDSNSNEKKEHLNQRQDIGCGKSNGGWYKRNLKLGAGAEGLERIPG